MVELRFSRSLYAEEAVRGAARAFEGLATVEVRAQEHALVVTLTDPHPAYAAVLPDELANHALALTAAGLASGAP